jgi:DNA-binding NarL/FixJ family response regulator
VELATRLVESPRRCLEVGALARLASVADGVAVRTGEAQRLREGVAALASDLGQHEEALRRWSECASTEADRYRSARASLRASEAALELARPRDAWLHWRRARDGSAGDAVLDVETLAQEAALYKYLEHQPQESRDAAERALAGARALASDVSGSDASDIHRRRALLRALYVAAEVALLFGDPEEMLGLAGELEMASTGFDDAVHIRALVEGAVALRFLGLNGDAEARLRQAWNTVHQKILPQRTLEVGAAFGNVLVSMGRLDEADAVLRECVALGTRLAEFRPSRTFALVLPHQLELLKGDWRTAVEGLRTAAAAEPDPHYRQHAHRERATAIARLDPTNGADEVREAVAEALQDAESAACVRCQAEALVRGAEALARIGDPAGARALVGRAEISPSDAHNRFWQQRALAAILSVSGAAADSAEALRAVIAEAERQGLYVEAVWAELDLGAVQVGYDRGAAIATLRHAGATAERMAATTEERVADQLLRALGVRTWRRQATAAGDDPLATLTPREREIALLVGAGSTNPEIASAVFLSRKTIERHVSNILAKLAVRNRAELAAVISHRQPSDTTTD